MAPAKVKTGGAARGRHTVIMLVGGILIFFGLLMLLAIPAVQEQDRFQRERAEERGEQYSGDTRIRVYRASFGTILAGTAFLLTGVALKRRSR